MRLIDADELKEVIYRSSVDTREKIKNIIDNAPTVDIKPFASFSFDKDELNRIVEERVIEPIKNGELVVKTEERPKGEWIVDEEHSITMTFYKCTNCNYFGGATHYRYCPRCGADMRKEAENETDN